MAVFCLQLEKTQVQSGNIKRINSSVTIMKAAAIQMRKTIFILLALSIALGANIAYGQWSDPSAVPPGSNAPAPVNIGTEYQNKNGDLEVNTLVADEVNSARYCDENGLNCSPAGVGGGDAYRCQTRSYLRNITYPFTSGSGSWISCGRSDWDCMNRYCQSQGYIGRHSSAANLKINSSWMTVFSCYRWDRLTYCGNY